MVWCSSNSLKLRRPNFLKQSLKKRVEEMLHHWQRGGRDSAAKFLRNINRSKTQDILLLKLIGGKIKVDNIYA